MRRKGISSLRTYYNDTKLLIHAVQQQQEYSRQGKGLNQISTVAAVLQQQEYPLQIQYPDKVMMLLFPWQFSWILMHKNDR